MLIQIEFQVCFLLEILVGIWQELRILLDLPDLVEVLREGLRPTRRVNPFRSLLDDLLDDLVLDDPLDVY